MVERLPLTGKPLGAESVNWKVKAVLPPVPSNWVRSAIASDGWTSSFWIVPSPCPSPIDQPALGFERTTVKVSLPSKTISPLTSTVTWRVA